MSVADLAARHCEPQEGRQPLSADDLQAHLAAVPGWALQAGAIEKRFAFADYHRTIAFVNAVAAVANAEDHHPALTVTYGQCVVRYDTHAVGGISINDFICAAKLDALSP